jgi:ribonuclease BN (tRNA processing enzyme)
MKLRILDTTLEGGAPKQYASSYLVNDVLAVDAGCLGFWRSPDDQAGIRHILITHTHLDHIASLPMFIENAYRPGLDSVTVYGLPETMDALQRHIFNDVIWPDFVRITLGGKPFVRLQPIKAGEPFQAAGLTVSAIRVDHIVPTCGFIVTNQRSTIIFGADSGPTRQLWEAAHGTPRPRAVVLEACFPNSMKELAQVSAHLTPEMFGEEVAKMPVVDRIIAVHLKEVFRKQVEQELASLGLPQLEIGVPSREYEI